MNHVDYVHIFHRSWFPFEQKILTSFLDDVAATAEKGSAGYVYQNIRWHFVAVALPDLYLTILKHSQRAGTRFWHFKELFGFFLEQ